MRHKVAGWKLGRNTSHRRSLLRNLVTSLILEEKIAIRTPALPRASGPAASKGTERINAAAGALRALERTLGETRDLLQERLAAVTEGSAVWRERLATLTPTTTEVLLAEEIVARARSEAGQIRDQAAQELASHGISCGVAKASPSASCPERSPGSTSSPRSCA